MEARKVSSLHPLFTARILSDTDCISYYQLTLQLIIRWAMRWAIQSLKSDTEKGEHRPTSKDSTTGTAHILILEQEILRTKFPW